MMMKLKVTALVLKKTKPTLSIKQKLKTTIELIWEWVKICFVRGVRPYIPGSPDSKWPLKADLDDADDDGGDDADEENDGCIYCI